MPDRDIERDRRDEFTGNEMDRARARIHNLADKVQGHEIFIEKQREILARVEKEVTTMRMEFIQQVASVRADATQQVTALRADSATKTELSAFTALATEKMGNLQKSIDKANDTLGKVAWIVITAVIMAVLGLVIVNRSAIGKVASSVSFMPDVVAFAPRR
jgi:CHASE3 domain sensor protein